ncbi:MAG: hypothetical protein ACKO86_20880, partial [Dolichospermum sp.]
AARLVQLGELRVGEISNLSYDIGMKILTRNPGEPIWEYDGPDIVQNNPSIPTYTRTLRGVRNLSGNY